MADYLDRKEFLFILTHIESLKLLGLKIGIDLANYDNLVVDRANKFISPSSNNIYPLIVSIENGEVVDYEYQSPSNPLAFARLRDVAAELETQIIR